MSTRSHLQSGSPYEADRDNDEQPGSSTRDKQDKGEESGKKSRREVDPPIKRQPNKPDKR